MELVDENRFFERFDLMHKRSGQIRDLASGDDERTISLVQSFLRELDDHSISVVQKFLVEADSGT